MNIQNNEISLLNKKFMGIKEADSETKPIATTTPLSENPETKPETEMAYLQAKANNNIAFQSLRTSMQPMEKAMKKMMVATAIAASGLFAASCTEKEYIEPNLPTIENTTNVTVNVDFNALIKFFEKMYQDQKITQEKYDQMIAYLKLMLEAQNAGNQQNAEFQKTVINMMLQDQATQEAILAQLIKNGQSQETANLFLEKLVEMMEKGDYASVLKAISDSLAGIENKLVILTSIESLLAQLVSNTEEMVTKEQVDELITGVNNIYESEEAERADNNKFKSMLASYLMRNEHLNRLMLSQLIKNGMSQEEANAKLDEIKSKGAEALNEIIKLLQSIDSKLAVITEWTAILNQIAENTDSIMSKEDAQAIIAVLTNIYNSQEAQNANDKEFKSMIVKALLDNTTLNKLIFEQLIKNGMSQEEANKKLDELIKAGGASLEEIKEILNSIDATVKDILAVVKEISANIVSYHEEYFNDREQLAEYMKLLFEQEEKQTELLSNINKTTTQMNAKLDSLRADLQDLEVIVSDPTQFNELINIIKNIKPGSIDYDRFEQMFNMLNKNMNEIADEAMNNQEAFRNELLVEIRNLKDILKNIDDKHAKLFIEISNKITLIISNFPKFDNEGIKNSILELYLAIQDNTGAIDKNTEIIGGQLEDVNAQLDKVLAKLDEIIAQIGKLSDEAAVRHQMYMEKWDLTLENFDKLIAKMEAGHIDIIEEIKALENSQNIANIRLATLETKANEVLNVLKNLNAGTNGGMTFEEYKNFSLERDAANFKKFEQLLADMGLDKVIKNQTTIIDLIKAIESKVGNDKDYSAQLETIIDLLKNLEQEGSNTTINITEIINLLKNWKCNCDCGNSSTNNEGILGDLQNKLG